MTYTMGGIAIDGEARVLRSDGSVIDGLFAAGSATGGHEGGPSAGYTGGPRQGAGFRPPGRDQRGETGAHPRRAQPVIQALTAAKAPAPARKTISNNLAMSAIRNGVMPR